MSLDDKQSDIKSAPLAMVKIHGLSFFEGFGVGRSEDGKVYFVEQACPGDTLEVEPYKNAKNYSFARIKNVIESSPFRVKPLCEVFSSCGGCSIQHVDYSVQIEEKQKTLQRYVTQKNSDLTLEPFEASEEIYNYRERMEVHVEAGHWGLYAKKSKNLIYPNECQTVIPEIQNFLKEKFPSDGHFHIDRNGVQKRSRGEDGVFGQINNNINLKLKDYLSEVLSLNRKDIHHVYDLYAGSGNYSLFLAQKFSDLRFTAVELSRKLVAKGIVETENLPNIYWMTSDVLKFVNSSFFKNPKTSMVIVNPPRTGLDPKLIPSILKVKPKKILYVSCNPMTLFRDIDALSPIYKTKSLKGFDMFPQTMHFETVALLNLE